MFNSGFDELANRFVSIELSLIWVSMISKNCLAELKLKMFISIFVMCSLLFRNYLFAE